MTSRVRALLGGYVLCGGLVASGLVGACDSGGTELVAETDDEAADFGRSALRDAVVLLSKTPEDPLAYKAFAKRVDELMPIFSRTVKREAELRLSTLAIAPLEAGLRQTPDEQMLAFATTVWPSVLEFPTEPGETSHDYVHRLCASEFALACNHVIPERWSAILNAKVWRALKSRVELAHSRCRWCDEDQAFNELVRRSNTIHLQLELAARRATQGGTPGDWPVAGPHASLLADELVVAFEAGGLVTVGGRAVEGGDWRGEIRDRRGETTRVGLHMAPSRLVADLLEVVRDMRIAGYSDVALVARRKTFPYEAVTYTVSTKATSRSLDVHKADTVQILVQALDHRIENLGL